MNEHISEVDVVVVGGGAAGLSAALVLSRARRSVLVVDAGSPRNAPAPHMHGFLSRDGFPPSELLAAARGELTGYGATIVSETALEIQPDGAGGHSVLLSDGRRIHTRRLLVATGLRDELPNIPGLSDRWARDVLHCPYCHGYEVRDQRLAVIGWSDDAVKYAHIVRQWSHDVVIFVAPGTLSPSDRNALEARSIGIVEGVVSRIVVENDQLRGVEVDGERVVARDAVFVPPRFIPNSDLLAGLGCALDDAGWVRADRTGRTSVDGVWVAGNVANPRAQVITAAGEGSAAAIAINADLVDEDVRNAVQAFERGASSQEE
jgi:thioredoxin reductase